LLNLVKSKNANKGLLNLDLVGELEYTEIETDKSKIFTKNPCRISPAGTDMERRGRISGRREPPDAGGWS
jgi:hypothetical protein